MDQKHFLQISNKAAPAKVLNTFSGLVEEPVGPNSFAPGRCRQPIVGSSRFVRHRFACWHLSVPGTRRRSVQPKNAILGAHVIPIWTRRSFAVCKRRLTRQFGTNYLAVALPIEDEAARSARQRCSADARPRYAQPRTA